MTFRPEEIRPERIGGAQPIGGEQPISQTAPSFESYMKSPEANPLVASGKTPQVSPFDIVHGQNPIQTGPTPQVLLAQVSNAQTTLGDLNMHLQTPNLKLRQSQRYILKNKLTEANTHMRAANAKLGSEPVQESKPPAGSGPIGKFLAYVTDGQNQMESAKASLQNISSKGENLNPADLMLIQLKLNKAQQELEYSSILLTKAVDDIKMLFGIQL